MRRLITASGAGLAAATLAILFWFSGTAGAQGSGSGNEGEVTSTTATTVFSGGTQAVDSLSNTGADTWLLVMGGGLATAGAVAARRLLRNPTS